MLKPVLNIAGICKFSAIHLKISFRVAMYMEGRYKLC